MQVLRIVGTLLCGCVAAFGAAGTVGAAGKPPSVPPTMRAAAIDKAGGPLTLHTLPVPKPGPDEMLIAVHTAGVGIWDTALREHPEEIKHSKFPLVLGTDGAGTVVALGSGVKGFEVGDEVYSYSWDNPQGGFYAEYVAVPAGRVGHVPPGIGLTEAGAIATTALTAIQGIDDALHVQRGENLVILGASGGVGSLAVEFAKLRGARVLAIASGDDGVDLVGRLGADGAVDGRQGDIRAASLAFAPGGVDAVLALAGGESLEHCLDALKQGGRVAFPTGVRPEPKARAGIRIIRYDAVPGAAEFERLNQAIETMKFLVPIAAQYRLEDAAEAQRRVEAGHLLGKVILRIR
ncbi:MAG TPA: NADP-dependent oxidoreductase [Steroidobacteraceae bacterium]|nr:NADP-dependent oxidoreductase [Steroidobacteraceae bacterium]